MEASEFRRELNGLSSTAGMNQRYHQAMQWRWGAADRATRIAVGLFAAVGVSCSVPGSEWQPASIVISLFGLAVALALNVVPFSEEARRYADLFRRWSDARQEIDSLAVKIKDEPLTDGVSTHLVSRLVGVNEKLNMINAAEPAAWRGLLVKCWEDEIESIWGKGIRTPEDVSTKMQSRDCEAIVNSPEAEEKD